MDWYHSLNKPALNPPDWIFAPMWTFLYITMAVSLLFYLKDGFRKDKTLGLTFFLVQLGLNLIWSPVFFYAENIKAALVICILLVIMIFLTISEFYKHSKPAAYILIPYFIWTIFAAYLNSELMGLN